MDGSCNNLLPGRGNFAAADQPFPRLATPRLQAAEDVPGRILRSRQPGGPVSSYAQKKGFVFDSQPRMISNLIDDQTSTNPAAVAAAQYPGAYAGQSGIGDTVYRAERSGGLHAGAQDAT